MSIPSGHRLRGTVVTGEPCVTREPGASPALTSRQAYLCYGRSVARQIPCTLMCAMNGRIMDELYEGRRFPVEGKDPTPRKL